MGKYGTTFNRETTIERFLTIHTTPVQTITTPDGPTVETSTTEAGAQFHWSGSQLSTKSLQAAKNPAGAIVGEWKPDGLYLFNTSKPLGKETLERARALGIPVVNIPETVAVTEIPAGPALTEFSGEFTSPGHTTEATTEATEAPKATKARTVKARATKAPEATTEATTS